MALIYAFMHRHRFHYISVKQKEGGKWALTLAGRKVRFVKFDTLLVIPILAFTREMTKINADGYQI